VVTTQIAPWDGQDERDKLVVGGVDIDFMRTSELAVLSPRVLYGETESRLQFHISIGQAF
jgi:hypothetical protein